MKRIIGLSCYAFISFSCALAQFDAMPQLASSSGAENLPGAGSGLDQQGTVALPLYGKVVMSDGSPVPPNINIIRSCGSDSVVAGYTDRKGHFDLQWNRPAGMMVSPAQAFMATDCEVHAEVPGYRSTIISLDSHTALDDSDIGIIVLSRIAGVEGLSVSATSFTAPPDARKAYDKGIQFARKGKLADADKEFQKAVTIYPQYANAWLDLGKVRIQNKQNDAAQEAFEKALAADEKLVEAHVELGLMAAAQTHWRDASTYLGTALRLDPVDYPRIWFVDAITSFNLQDYDRAEKSVREALSLDPNHNVAQERRLLGMVLAAKHDYVGAVAELRAYISLAPHGTDVTEAKTQLSQLELLESPNQH